MYCIKKGFPLVFYERVMYNDLKGAPLDISGHEVFIKLTSKNPSFSPADQLMSKNSEKIVIIEMSWFISLLPLRFYPECPALFNQSPLSYWILPLRESVGYPLISCLFLALCCNMLIIISCLKSALSSNMLFMYRIIDYGAIAMYCIFK